MSKSRDLGNYGTAALADTQSSPTDTTAGSLMAVGAFGLGFYVVSTETDLNNYNTPGRYITPATGLTNLPPGFIQCRYFIDVGGSDNFHNYQKLYAVGIASGGRFSAERNYYGGVAWQPWNRNYNAANAVGTVAADGSGAIIEKYQSGIWRVTILASGAIILRSTEVYSATANVDGLYNIALPEAIIANYTTSALIAFPTITNAFVTNKITSKANSATEVQLRINTNVTQAYAIGLIITGDVF